METIIGIDLGTTNSEVAVVRENGEVHVFREDGNPILPSVVGVDERGELLVGIAARNQMLLAPERTVKSVKRQMGQDVKIRLGTRDFQPQEISAMILRKLKDRAERELGHSVSKAVITVPAFFNDNQREATRQAGELAGLEVVRILNEPTAAALTYEPHPTDLERILVYDLGGGTFDVSIVQIEQGVVEVLASHGDTQLGGDDFDQLLFDHICDQFQEDQGIDLRLSAVAKSRVLRAAEEAKKELSSTPVVQISEEFIAEKDGVPLHLQMELERGEYEELIDPLIRKTLTCVDQALTDSKLQLPQISKVVLVGGATRTPLIQELLRQRLRQPLHTEVNPDLGVAMGAAIQGAMIAGRDVGPVLVDITPHTMGVRVVSDFHRSEYLFSPIINRNTALPASRSELYTTSVDNQKVVEIEVFQGENEDVRRNEQVGMLLLEGLSHADRGNQILVRFDLDLNGILKVTAIERSTGLEKHMVIDNALSRFRHGSRDGHVKNRLNAAFASSPDFDHIPIVDVVVTSKGQTERQFAADTPASSASLPAWQAEGRALIQKAREVLATSSEEDQRELLELLDEVGEAITAGSEQRTRAAVAKLEDLVFYLQDA